MYFKIPYPKQKILEIVEEEADPLPDLLKCVLTLNACRYVGLSSVCAILDCSSFELRNRHDPYLSLRAKGTIIKDGAYSILQLTWEKPWPGFFGRMFRNYEKDKQIILDFMKTELQAKALETHPGMSTRDV